ncbi:MAG: DegV family protein [Clostridia bacterium]|nr:DegV family protein [Clostridia bacterium]
MSYVLSCCSAADLSKEHFEQRGIHYISFHYRLGEKEYSDDLGQTVPYEDFYRAMVEGAETHTSQINTDEYEAYFEGFLRQGQDVLHLVLSSGITNSLQSAEAAARNLAEKYPERRVVVIDSLAASSGFGLLADLAADKRDEGYSIDQLADWIRKNRLRIHHWFFSTDLTFYIKGGRVSKTAGFVGRMLNICPLLNVDVHGKLIPREKIRTVRRAITVTEEHMERFAEDRLNYSGKCYISHSDCPEQARALADLIESRFPKLDGRVQINWIGSTIGAHSGPGTVALFFLGDERVD